MEIIYQRYLTYARLIGGGGRIGLIISHASTDAGSVVGRVCCFQVLVISHASTDAGSLVGWKEVPHRPRVGGLWIVNQI